MSIDPDDELEVYRNKLLEMISHAPPETRTQLFGMAMGTEVARFPHELVEAICGQLSTISIAIIHTCMMHPEWMAAVVKDSKWFEDLCIKDEYVDTLELITRLYPLAPQRDSEEGYDEWLERTKGK